MQSLTAPATPADQPRAGDPLPRATTPRPPIRNWAIRYSIRHDSGIMGGTVTIPLRTLPAGMSANDVAVGLLELRVPGATAILPRAVLLDEPDA